MTRKAPAGGTSGMRSRNNAARPRQQVASKEYQELRKKKRQQQVRRNRIVFATVCVVFLLLVIFLFTKLFGFISGSGKKAETSTITFESDGKVVFEEIVDFDTDTYSKSELKDYTKDLISSYNDTCGEEAIELDKVSVSGGKAYVKSTYRNVDDYSAFTSYQTYSGTYEGALEASYDFSTQYCMLTVNNETEEVSLTDGQSIDTDTTFAGKKVIIVDENVTVVVPGTIEYVSDANVEAISENTIKISSADGNEDATSLVYIIYTAE